MGCNAPRATALMALTVCLVSSTVAHAGSKWRPVDAHELALTRPSVDPDAGAEVLLWRITVEDAITGPNVLSDVTHFLRVKVFDQRGVEAVGNPDIVYDKGTSIVDFAARTVRPDGSMVEVTKADRFERTIVKADGIKRKALSFAFPALAPGVVLEYHWTERRYDEDIDGVQLILQRDLPVCVRELRIKPLQIDLPYLNFKVRYFGMQPPTFSPEKDGFQRALLPPIRGTRTEPYMPPELQSVPWAVLYYGRDEDPEPKKLWEEFASERWHRMSERIKVDNTVRRAAEEIVVGASTDEERLDRIAAWCRASIERWDDDIVGAPARDLEKMPKNRTPSQTLKRKGGRANDLVYLFIALCRSLGLDASIALTANRSYIFFNSKLRMQWPLTNPIAVVRLGERRRFYDPGVRWIHGDGLAWWEDGQEAFVLGKDQGAFIQVPMAPPDSTHTIRSCRGVLRDDGTFEGDVRIAFCSLAGATEREWLDDLTPDERLERIRTTHLPSLPGLVMSHPEIDALEDTSHPLVVRCSVRIPNYGATVGSRLIVPVAFFNQGRGAVFPSDDRTNPVYFHRGWCETDSVWIDLPDGFDVEAAPVVQPLEARGVGSYRANALVSMDGRSVRLLQSFRFGDGDAIYFPTSEYPTLKRFFDGVGERVRATLSLKHAQTDSGQSGGGGASEEP